jgi:hypothetical protein
MEDISFTDIPSLTWLVGFSAGETHPSSPTRHIPQGSEALVLMTMPH